MKKSYPKLPDGSVLIGDRKYRAGFIKADWDEDGGHEQFESHHFKLKMQREHQLFFDGIIYHYTTISGFKGIIDSNGFWASDNRFMNDTEELYHGFELVKSVVEQLEGRERLPDFKAILTALLHVLPRPHENSSLVSCFSLSRDSLEQWRGYGPSGGICIGLKGRSPEEEAPIIAGPDLLLHRVIYGRRAKIVHILSVIRRFRHQYILDRRAMDIWPDDHDKNYVEALRGWLTYAAVLFKNDAFRSEQEVRYVIPPAHADRFTGGIEFRASSVGIIPFVNTAGYGASSKRLPVSEITVGPSPHQEVIASSVETFLSVKGYQNVEVKLSNVPFRSF